MKSINNFSKNLYKIRTNLNITHEQLAEKCNISSRIIYDYESGLKLPSIHTLLKIAVNLNVTTDSLFEE